MVHKNVHVDYFQPNLTLILQSCYAGIIVNFLILVEQVSEKIESGPIMSDLKQCM